MTKKYNVAVIGATGNVGGETLKILAERNFPINNIYAIASDKSVGKEVSFGKGVIKVLSITDFDFSKINIAFFCAGSEISKKYAKLAAESGAIVIDKSSFYRLDPKVPLIIPEVNFDTLNDYACKNIIANPNCCTIPIALALKPLDNFANIERTVISTYQSVSGAGRDAMEELYSQTKDLSSFRTDGVMLNSFQYLVKTPEILKKVQDDEVGSDESLQQGQYTPKFPKPIAFNVIPQIGDFNQDGYTEEENKISLELQKIISPSLKSSITCVRVPVFVGHSLSVNIELKKMIDASKAIEILQESEGIKVLSGKGNNKYFTPIEVGGKDLVYVSRVRDDHSRKNSINLWICSDNLRKGAALNAVQIAESVIQTLLN